MASTGLIVHRHYHAAVLNAFGSLDRRTLQTIAIQLPRNSSYYHKTPGNRNSSPHLPLVFCLPQNLTSSWFIPYHLIILSHKENATNDNGMPILRMSILSDLYVMHRVILYHLKHFFIWFEFTYHKLTGTLWCDSVEIIDQLYNGTVDPWLICFLIKVNRVQIVVTRQCLWPVHLEMQLLLRR